MNPEIINNFKGSTLKDKLFGEFLAADEIRIASGYVGWSTIDEFKEIFLKVAERGGKVKIIIGMAFWEGLSQRIFDELSLLNDCLKEFSPKSGVFFCVKRRFHGKFYLAEKGLESFITIGSSNFSSSGLSEQDEANICEKNSAAFIGLSRYFRDLEDEAEEFNKATIKIKGKEKSPLKPVKPSNKGLFNPEKHLVSFEIPIKTTPKSNINISCGAGRWSQSTQKYAPRPFYEMELNISRSIFQGRISNFIPNVIDPFRFHTVTENGMEFEALIKRKTAADTKSIGLHKTGGDFMSSPRADLGLFIKGKLIEDGILRFGQQVTDEMLEEANAKYLAFHKIEANTFGLSLKR